VFRFFHEVSSLKGFIRLVYRCCHASIANQDSKDKRDTLLVAVSDQRSVPKKSSHEIDRVIIHQIVDKCDDLSTPPDHSEPMLYSKVDPHCPISSEIFHVSLMKYLSHSSDATYLGWGAITERVSHESLNQVASWIDSWQQRYDLPLAVSATLQSIAAQLTQEFSVTNFDLASDGAKVVKTLEVTSQFDPATLIPQLVRQYHGSGVHSIVIHKTSTCTRISFTLPLRVSESSSGLKAVIFLNVPTAVSASSGRPKSA
jgi:hypothetical protein